MNEIACRHCGEPKCSHAYTTARGLVCLAKTSFEPEHPKAKPGVRYRLLGYHPERGERMGVGIGLANGMLAIPLQTDEPMSPFWQEVPE